MHSEIVTEVAKKATHEEEAADQDLLEDTFSMSNSTSSDTSSVYSEDMDTLASLTDRFFNNNQDHGNSSQMSASEASEASSIYSKKDGIFKSLTGGFFNNNQDHGNSSQMSASEASEVSDASSVYRKEDGIFKSLTGGLFNNNQYGNSSEMSSVVDDADNDEFSLLSGASSESLTDTKKPWWRQNFYQG